MFIFKVAKAVVKTVIGLFLGLFLSILLIIHFIRWYSEKPYTPENNFSESIYVYNANVMANRNKSDKNVYLMCPICRENFRKGGNQNFCCKKHETEYFEMKRAWDNANSEIKKIENNGKKFK